MNTHPLFVYPELLINLVNTNVALDLGAVASRVIAQPKKPRIVKTAPTVL
jgi:hypothetical protein